MRVISDPWNGFPKRYTSRNCHPADRRRSRGGTAPAIDDTSGGIGSDRETLAAAVPAALEYSAASAGAHTLAESVDLLPAAVMRLKGALHFEWPRSWETDSFDIERGSLPDARGPGQRERRR